MPPNKAVLSESRNPNPIKKFRVTHWHLIVTVVSRRLRSKLPAGVGERCGDMTTIDLNIHGLQGVYLSPYAKSLRVVPRPFRRVSVVLGRSWNGKGIKAPEQTKWIKGTMYLLILIGASGFFAAALSATGIIKLPPSYERPAGYARGGVSTGDGKHIVPLTPSGRLQIYDSHWYFIRGWNVDAGGGEFKVQCSANDEVEVLTARGEHHYSFTQDVRLLSSEGLSQPFASLPNEGQSVVVPTSPLLWIFSSPFLSWGVAVVGFVGLAVLKKMGHRPGLGS